MFSIRQFGAAGGLPAVVASLVLSACGGGESSVQASSSASTLAASSETSGDTSSETSATTTGEAAGRVSALAVGTTATSAAVAAQAAAAAVQIAKTAGVANTQYLVNHNFAQGGTGWTLSWAATLPSELRSGGTALGINWQAVQPITAAPLVAHHSYEFAIRCRTATGAESATIAITFRQPNSTNSFRTFSRTITAGTYATYMIDFTAPEYTGNVDVSIVSAGGKRFIVDYTSLREINPIAQTEAITSPDNSYAPAGYTLAFNDEFNGKALNRSKWFTRYIYGMETTDRLNDEKQRYRDNGNQVVSNGVLSLVAKKVSDSDPAGINYESGMIRSDWTARYGYFEARVKMPKGLGVWPAFWLNSDVSSTGRLSWPPEIDIFEYVNNGVEDLPNMFHSAVSGGDLGSPFQWSDPLFNTSLKEYIGPAALDDSWHTFGCLWDETSVTVFLDGKKLFTRGFAWNYADGTQAAPAHILLNLAIGGAWAGRHGIDDSAFPQAMQIDWVRAYKKAG